MEVQFYYSQSDDRMVNKVLSAGETIQGIMRDECNIMSPVIRFQSASVLRYNYCYIPELQRYYTVVTNNIVRNDVYDVTFSVDVLMSFRGDIMQLQCIVDKQTDLVNGDEYIDDGSLVCDNIMFNRIYEFSGGFNNSPEYILITAG